MWPKFFIEALEGGDVRDRGALLSSLLVGQWGLGRPVLSVLDVGVGYVVDDFVPLAATRTSEYVLDTRFPLGCAEHVPHVILD